METRYLLLLRTLVSLGSFRFVLNQICDEGSYTVTNTPRRSVQAVFDDTVDTPLCDYGIYEGTWYRFDSYSGNSIVERAANDPVPPLHCGTQAPIYIRGIGSHPMNTNETTNPTVCANYGGDPCKWTSTIQIYKCPDYYLYKLKSPPGCSLSYCVGEKLVCNQGDYWNGSTCVNYFPPMTGFPKFSKPQTNGSERSTEVYFTCEVQCDPQPEDSTARYRVTFLFDGQPLEYIQVAADEKYPPEHLQPTILYPNSSMVAVLSEFYLRGRLGREIFCQAESYWDGYSDASPILRSEDVYEPALESTADSYTINLTNGSTFIVTFKSTLPFTCSHCVKAEGLNQKSCCKYNFRLLDYSASTMQCTLLWTEDDKETVKLIVYFVPGATAEGKSFALVFEKYIDDFVYGPALWHDYLIPTVMMTTLPMPEPYKACFSSGDPHFTTFDGASGTPLFDNFMVGDFSLVRVANGDQLMEIQVRHELCNGGKVTCNCGVAVREGNSVIRISICEAGTWSLPSDRSPTVVRLLGQDPPDASAVYIDGTGRIFSVRMPSGLRVEINLSGWFNLAVYLPPQYYGKTDSASMCGNSNGNSNDDLPTNSDSFRIPDDLSYFRHQPVCSTIYNVEATRCGCNNTYPICSNQDPTLKSLGLSTPDKPFPWRSTTVVVCSRTPVAAVASLSDSDNSNNDFKLDKDDLFPSYIYDPHFGVNVSFSWPTPNGKTEEEVERYCSGVLKSSPAYTDCSTTVDLTTIINNCVSDIQIADDWISVGAYVNVFQQSCLNKLVAKINDSDDSSSNSAFDSVRSVSGKLCPNQCSDRGNCSNGTCICNTGYIGADCSIDQTRPPSLNSIARNGACDVRSRPCNVISVFGSGVAYSSALKCRFTDQITDAHVETRGTFITAGEYSCPVPETTTHRRRRSVAARTIAMSTKTVSITIDGVLYSNALDFVLYDSVCMECNNSATCRRKDDSCIVSGQCFADGDANPDNACLQCAPSLDRNQLTDVTVVENWSPCTRSCDIGVETRKTVCGTSITNVEVAFCKELNCQANAEQKTQGFGISLSSEDLKIILLDSVESLASFAEALNRFCSKNAAVCCNSIGTKTSVSAVTYTSSNLLTYAAGYPVIGTSDTSLKIIVKIDHAKLAAECSQSQTQGSNIVYADSKLIYDAVKSEQSGIEQELGVIIKSISKPAESKATASASYSLLYPILGVLLLLRAV